MQSHAVSSHLQEVLLQPNRKETIRWLLQALTPRKDLFDGIAVCGTSGLLVGPIVADALEKDIVLIRKPSDNSHSFLLVEGYRPGRYVIIDDLICTGKTIALILQAMKVHCEHSECVGIVLYHSAREYFYDSLKNMLAKLREHPLKFEGNEGTTSYRSGYSI